jgi:hypothetical protein
VRKRAQVLYVTDPDYPARGRDYAAEDRLLVDDLRRTFEIETCPPQKAPGAMARHDLVVVRNSGPVAAYPEAYAAFRDEAGCSGTPVYNELTGKADMVGKQYLLDLSAEGRPVIPTVASVRELAALPATDAYVVKPLLGADSAGLYVADAAQLASEPTEGMLIQPRLDIAYEVSFYFVDDVFVYALHTPDPEQRWELAPYTASEADLAFARGFIEWNDIRHGIQRVDAARTTDGELLLVELEDLNPYLSLDRTTEAERARFVQAFTEALQRLLASAG